MVLGILENIMQEVVGIIFQYYPILQILIIILEIMSLHTRLNSHLLQVQ
nr:MAG TPA: hypothetical protein [Bacteriophage sp.]